MSALQYLNVMSKQIAKDDTSSKQKQEQKDKKYFKHGNNIIMKLGTYKGYYGYVYDFFPSKIEIEIEDQQYINAKPYGDKKVGSTIVTEFGDSTIIEKKKKMFILNIENKKVRLNKDDVMHVLEYKKDGKIRFGLFENTENEEINIKPIKLNYEEQSREKLIEELSKRIKENDFYTADIQKINKSEINLPELFFIKKNENAGLYSSKVQVIPEQFLITYKKQLQLLKSQLKRQSSKLYTILSGPYKGKSAEFVKFYPAHLSVYIDAAGKKVTKHMVKTNGSYVERYIYPADVFYMDILLTNGNMFEVKEITEENVIIGLEKTKDTLIPRQISKDDIQSLQPGFAFTKETKEKLELEESIYSYGEPSYEEKEFQDQELDEEKEESDFADAVSENEEDVNEEAIEVNDEFEDIIEKEDDVKYKSSYKDIERITFVVQELSKEQQKIKNRIEKITKQFSINVLNEFKLIEQVENAIKSIKKELEQMKMNFWNISDEKYIIASIVLFDIIKSGFGESISNIGEDTLSSYIQELITGSRPFFNKKDYTNSVFMRNGWSNSFEFNDKIFKSLVNSKNQVEIHKYIMSNCILVLEEFYGKVNLDVRPKKNEDIIMLGKRKYEDEPRTRITVKDIFTKNITQDANTILWGIAYQPLLEKYKSKLIEKINDENSNKTTKLVYDYVLQNLERGMFALKEVKEEYEKTNSVIDKLKFEKMSKIWKNLLDSAEIIYKNLEKEKYIKKSKAEKEKKELMTRRETISTTKRLKSFGLEDEDESIELKQERKFPSYLERMIKKHKL